MSYETKKEIITLTTEARTGGDRVDTFYLLTEDGQPDMIGCDLRHNMWDVDKFFAQLNAAVDAGQATYTREATA